jgi:hypothetical protein
MAQTNQHAPPSQHGCALGARRQTHGFQQFGNIHRFVRNLNSGSSAGRSQAPEPAGGIWVLQRYLNRLAVGCAAITCPAVFEGFQAGRGSGQGTQVIAVADTFAAKVIEPGGAPLVYSAWPVCWLSW